MLGGGYAPWLRSALAAEETSQDEAIEGEGFNIDLTWLSESKKTLNWNDETMRSFAVNRYKVDGRGTLTDVLGRLTREQAEDFTNQITKRVEKQQPGLFG